jgi:DNA-binding ferritin-like protein (Dps family)
MNKIIETVIGNLDAKKEWREIEKRAKALPSEYRSAYEKIKKYIWNTAGVETIKPFENLVDLFEEGVANGKKVLELTGKNVADFADELVRGEKSYYEKMRAKLNNDIVNKK